jgi:hypothetical protein
MKVLYDNPLLILRHTRGCNELVTPTPSYQIGKETSTYPHEIAKTGTRAGRPRVLVGTDVLTTKTYRRQTDT